jgi:molecular chaperone GrpE
MKKKEKAAGAERVKDSEQVEKVEKIEELKTQLVRALADYDNLSKRTEEEKTLWLKFASTKIVSRLLPILDMLESAQNHLKDSGLAIVVTEFKKVISEEGIEEIKPEIGSDYNEKIEEVIDTVDTTDKNKNNKIESLALIGWKFKDGPVIRPAKVKVFKFETRDSTIEK